MFRLVRTDPAAVEVAFAVKVDMPAVAVLGIDGDRVVGSGGLAWGGQRCWLWFGMTARKASYAVPIFRETKRMLRRAVQLGETGVWTVRDEAEPMSKKLLTMLGFELHGQEEIDGKSVEVWRWQS